MISLDRKFAGKRIALAGFGAEGRNAAGFFAKNGMHVEVFDSRQEKDFPEQAIADLRGLGVILHFGNMGPFSGFDIIVRSPGISPRIPELAEAVKQGIQITSATKIFFDICPCPIVGVTGTKGKGTTSSLIHEILLAGGKDSHLGGNIGVPALGFLDELKSDSVAVYELSSFQLMELDKSPQVAVVLMVTSEHLDFHASTEEYVSSKANIVRFQRAEDKAVINIDYPASNSMSALTSAEFFAISRKKIPEQGAYVENGMIRISQHGKIRDILPAVEVPLLGAHNLENVCAAAMAAALLGIPDVVIAETIRSFRPLHHRLELVREKDGVKYFDDSMSSTPESTIAALASFEVPKILILGGSSKDSDWDALADTIAKDPLVKAIIGIGQEWPVIKQAIQKHDCSRIDFIDNPANMSEIVAFASGVAKPGDIVLLSPACASFGMFKNYYDRGEQFVKAVQAL